MTDTSPESIDPKQDGFLFRHNAADQLTLFTSEELVVPNSLLNVRKSISAIYAIPVKSEHNHTLNTRRLFDAMILIAQLDFKKQGKERMARVISERISPMFEVRVTDLVRLAGIPGKNFQRIYEDLELLQDMKLKWNAIGEDDQVDWAMVSYFISSLGRGVGKNRGLIRFSIPPEILEIILEPKHWATLSLQASHSLKTPSSIALFQTAWRYVNTYKKVTAALPTETWIELLCGTSRYVREEDGKIVANYADFKRRVLMDAIERVNEVPALSFTLKLKEYHSGNRVSRLQFEFVPKQQASLGLPATWPDTAIGVLKSIGFSEEQIAVLGESHSLEEVTDSIVRLKQAEIKIRAKGGKISNRKSYFEGILTNVASGESGEDMDVEKLEAEARAMDEQREADLREERAKGAFSQHVSATFAARLFEMPDEKRLPLLAEFEASELGAKARPVLENGRSWSARNVGALAMLRTWMQQHRPDVYNAILHKPEDKTLEAWLAWRLDSVTQQE